MAILELDDDVAIYFGTGLVITHTIYIKLSYVFPLNDSLLCSWIVSLHMDNEQF